MKCRLGLCFVLLYSLHLTASVPQKHVVKKGETLASISKRYFGSSSHWRAILELNPSIKVSDLKVGTELLLPEAKWEATRKTASVPGVGKVSVVKLKPTLRDQGPLDLDSAPVLHQELKNRLLPLLLVLSPEDTVYGTISGAYVESAVLDFHTPIYVEAKDGVTFTPKQTFAVVREEREIKDLMSSGTPELGKLVRLVGEVSMVETGEKYVRFNLTKMYSLVRRGDYLIQTLKPLVPWAGTRPPNELQARIIQGEESDYKSFVQGQLVILNKGSREGMKEGYLFRVFHEKDLKSDVESKVEPESKGEIQIVHVGALASLGYIIRNIHPLLPGDTLIPTQAFSDRPPPPRRDTAVIPLD